MRHQRIAALTYGAWEWRFPQLLHVTIGDASVWSATLGVMGEGATDAARWEAFAEAMIAHWRRYVDTAEGAQSENDIAVRLVTRDHVQCVKRPKQAAPVAAKTAPWESS